jgi:uncharacterized protein (DUF305 family)
MTTNTHRRTWAGTLIASLVLAGPDALAQATDHSGHAGHTAAAEQPKAKTDATKEYEAAANKMHGDMTLPYTNNVDVDFVRGMIPHHQGAIDQSKILLKYSKNPRLRRLAGGIIVAQRREKGVEMEAPDWLKNTAVPDDVRDPKID